MQGSGFRVPRDVCLGIDPDLAACMGCAVSGVGCRFWWVGFVVSGVGFGSRVHWSWTSPPRQGTGDSRYKSGLNVRQSFRNQVKDRKTGRGKSRSREAHTC